MKSFIKFFLILFLPLMISCKDKNDKISETSKNTTAPMNINDKLKDGINVSNSFIEDLDFNKYKYNGEYIEQIEVSSLEDQSFRNSFFKFLTSRNFDQGQYEQVFFIKLLLVRIQQLDDIRSYYFLSLIFNDQNLGYYLEDYELDLFQLFLYKPSYFIKGEYKYKQNKLLDYINQNLPQAFLTNKDYFDKNIVDINFQKDALLISEDAVNKFSIPELKKQIEKSDKVEAIFSPSYDTGWKNKTVIYYNLYHYIDDKIVNKLDKNELSLYNVKYKPFFKSYIIKGENTEYYIHDSDGYTNLRKDKNTSSEIVEKINSGEQVEVLDQSGDWWLVKTKNGKQGYVHKSRIK